MNSTGDGREARDWVMSLELIIRDAVKASRPRVSGGIFLVFAQT